MTQTIKKFINDSAAARWTALILIASNSDWMGIRCLWNLFKF